MSDPPDRGHFFSDDPQRWHRARNRGMLRVWPSDPPPSAELRELRDLRAEVAQLRELAERLAEQQAGLRDHEHQYELWSNNQIPDASNRDSQWSRSGSIDLDVLEE